jgi:hypothetical protein
MGAAGQNWPDVQPYMVLSVGNCAPVNRQIVGKMSAVITTSFMVLPPGTCPGQFTRVGTCKPPSKVLNLYPERAYSRPPLQAAD